MAYFVSPLACQLCNYQALIIMQLSMLVKGCHIIDFQSMFEKQRQSVLHLSASMNCRQIYEQVFDLHTSLEVSAA